MTGLPIRWQPTLVLNETILRMGKNMSPKLVPLYELPGTPGALGYWIDPRTLVWVSAGYVNAFRGDGDGGGEHFRVLRTSSEDVSSIYYEAWRIALALLGCVESKQPDILFPLTCRGVFEMDLVAENSTLKLPAGVKRD